MPLPVPNLDDRRFDDLVAEARARLAGHLPELTQIAPGDPLHAFTDLFAWLTETILFRANAIPERQRRVVLNLLQVPIRAARPARGLACIDPPARSSRVQPLVPADSTVSGAGIDCTTEGEVQPLPLLLHVVAKEALAPDLLETLGYTLEDLRAQHGLAADETPQAFRPRHFQPADEPLTLAGSLDHCYYLALALPRSAGGNIGELRADLAGKVLNIGLMPPAATGTDADGLAAELPDRALTWELLVRETDGAGVEQIRALPLEVAADASGGARRPGVVRLRLPRNATLMQDLAVADPLEAGVGQRPPELPEQVDPARVALWLRLACPGEPDFPLGWIGINAVAVTAQGLRTDLMLGLGTGQPDQVLDLPDLDVDPASLALQVEDTGRWVDWTGVDILYGQPDSAQVYRLDARAGRVHFGDGINGRRPRAGKRIRAARYRHGGGAASNLPKDSLKSVASTPDLRVRQERPLEGGIDAEDVARAERRIPQFLAHRNRAVTAADFRLLAADNPINPVARAEVVPGLLPGTSIRTLRRDVPGVVSVFVVPPGPPAAVAATPRPTPGLLRDVFDYLLARVSVGTELYVLSAEYVQLALGVAVDVADATTEQATLLAVRQALAGFLWPLAPGGASGQGWGLGTAVRAAEIAVQVARVGGVRAVNKLTLFARGPSNAGPNAGPWRAVSTGELVLTDYQLPDLVGVQVRGGSADPTLPAGLGDLPAGGGDHRRVPAPVIPDLC
ncbi:MAG: baseplate J/gp47 family protein [Thiohalocapsa sp.]|uniref:baseplate J/gp47 family protein n=1 Tax=Thiohalocapsa sp. TaxID=2497641 RepID=UPI0025D78AD3|nr:baseplate J/gp47 family protein [Thiohalocapsa sp.]MCG6942870.1 baseplate J/gp47 family protein [Thiohalocapsa sp.]